MTAKTGRSRYWTIWKCHELKGTHEGRSWPKWKLSSVEHCCCLLDILVVTFALLISVTDTCQPSCLLSLQCKWFWKLAALCVCVWPEFSSFLFIWHFKYFYLELSHEFLLRIILLGEELKDKNRDPSDLQTERLERSGKAFGKAGNLCRERGGSKCYENWQNCEKRFSAWFPLLFDFTMTTANRWRPEHPLLLFVVKFEKNLCQS